MPTGYYDYICASDINECDSSPCRHGASCIDGINAYDCKCQNGYEGSQCQDDINECSANPCQHGASCHDLLGRYRCQCSAGYTGMYKIEVEVIERLFLTTKAICTIGIEYIIYAIQATIISRLRNLYILSP